MAMPSYASALPVRAVLFDAFGTVVHPEPGWEGLRAACLTVVHGTWTGRAVPLERWLAAYEKARAEQHDVVRDGYREFDFPARFARSLTLCGVAPVEADAWGELAHERYHRFQSGLVHAYDSPGPTLARLKRDGYKLALVSNYAHTDVLRDALARLGLLAHFDAFIVSADVGYMKPHARIFEAALEALDIVADEAVMVGNDLQWDVAGAKGAGIRSIWTPYPRVSPAPPNTVADAVVERLADIPDVLQRFG